LPGFKEDVILERFVSIFLKTESGYPSDTFVQLAITFKHSIAILDEHASELLERALSSMYLPFLVG